MPIFDYKCNACGEIFEVIHIKEDSSTRCKCGCFNTERQFPSGIGIQFVDDMESGTQLFFTNRYSNKKRKRKRHTTGMSNEKTRDAWY